MVSVAATHPRNSRVAFRFLNEDIFHAKKLATKLANEPNTISTMTLGMGLTTLEIAHPTETPIITAVSYTHLTLPTN